MHRPALVLRYGWLPVLAVFVLLTVGHVGFSPLDEGFVLSQSWRLLHGELPHADVVSPRPLGSAFVHVVDFAVPLPTAEGTRLVSALQVTLYSALLARFLYRRPLREWNAFQVVGAAGSALVNLHVFPLMAWHTVDGITFVAAGLNLVDTGRKRLVWAGMACLGAAAVMKQSFVPAPVIGGLWVLWSGRAVPWREKLRTTGPAALAALAPVVAYLAVVAVGGGVGDMLDQFRAAGEKRVYGQGLVTVFRDPAAVRAIGIPSVLFASAVLLASGVRLLPRLRILLPVAAGVGAFATWRLLRVPLDEEFGYAYRWGLVLAWVLIAALAAWFAVHLRVEWRAVAVLLVGWMTMLSWGYAVPHLVAGSLLLAALHLLWRDLRPRPQALRVALLGMAVAALVVTADGVLDARRNMPYFDAPSEELTYRLSRADSAFGRLRTNPTTGAYVKDVSDCIRRHPARRVAVLPDYPAAYSYLKLRNPFPLDWLLDAEVLGSEDRILRAAETLDRKGDYLVLFAASSAFNLKAQAEARPEESYLRHPFGAQIAERLSGEHVTCGSFTAVYDPGD